MTIDLEQRIADLERQLTEAREQQTATAEVVGALAASPAAMQPVLDALVDSARRLCTAEEVSISRLTADGLRLIAASSHRAGVRLGTLFPFGPGGVISQSILDRAPLQVVGLRGPAGDRFPRTRAELAEQLGIDTILSVPLLRQGEPIGAITLRRLEPIAFTDRQVALLETFAAQAVIAIENARLFQELQERNRDLSEALDRETATGAILRVMSQSPANVEPVLNAVAESAAQVCGAGDAIIRLLDGDRLKPAAHAGTVFSPEWQRSLAVRPESVAGCAVLRRQTIHVPDLREVGPDEFSATTALLPHGVRTMLSTPLLREGEPIGVITIRRTEVRPFTDQQLRLLETFANQAVVAIENAHLFQEVQERNDELEERTRELSEALEKQTATAAILGVMSQSAADYQPVLDTVVDSAARLCHTEVVVLYLVEGDATVIAASVGVDQTDLRHGVGRLVPLSPDRIGTLVIREGQTIHLPAGAADPRLDRYANSQRSTQRIGAKAALYAPLLRDGEAIGYIGLSRRVARPFSEQEIRLVETFADQAVIAIENARLFQELQARNRELEERTQELSAALEQQTATAEILRVMSTSPTNSAPVFDAVVASATRVCGADRVSLNLVEGDDIVLIAEVNFPDPPVGARWRRTPDRLADHVMRERRTVHVTNFADPAFDRFPGLRRLQQRIGYRVALEVPLVLKGVAIGYLALGRNEARPFSEAEIALVETFANQAVIAIENARLFEEVQATSRQLAQASQHKSEFLANMSHELRTPLNGIIGFSDILLNPDMPVDPDTGRQFLTNINEAGQHLLTLINDILDLSKVEAGKMELHPDDFDLADSLRGVQSVVKALADKKQQRLLIEAPAEPITLYHDPGRFKQVLFNLLSNAVKFTPDGGRVTTTARVDGEWVEVAVQDTGIGIAPADQGKVFEEFQQIDSGYARQQQGTGLGLALVRSFVRLMGGDITLQSALGEGSTFTVRLPIRQPALVPAITEPASSL